MKKDKGTKAQGDKGTEENDKERNAQRPKDETGELGDAGDQKSEVKDQIAETGELKPETAVTQREGRFVDVSVEQRPVPVKIPDERLLEFAEEANEKRHKIKRLKAEIKATTASLRGEIAELLKEADVLDERFAEKSELLERDVRVIKDFGSCRIRIENVDSGEVIEDRDFLPDEFQRDFAALLESVPSDQFLQRAVDAISRSDASVSVEELPQVVAEVLGVSAPFGKRVVDLLIERKVLVVTGSEDDVPFYLKDVMTQCEFCNHRDSEVCKNCSGDDNWPAFETAEKCISCRFRRQFRCFAPCNGCDPLVEPKGFAPVPMDNE